jgi:flavin-dependent dehydrogenase
MTASEERGIVLDDGSRVGVVGGGPAGSFFAFFLLEMSRRIGLDIQVDIYEPRDFSKIGPQGCNMCGGIISESLVQTLAVEGIKLPPAVVQRGIDSYFLHMDVGSVRIDTPLQEKRIAAVHRGCGPRDSQGTRYAGFDNFLLELAISKGARRLQQRVMGVNWDEGRPRVKAQTLTEETYDLLALAVGVNSTALKLLEGLGIGYQAPRSTKTYIRELCLGEERIKKYLGSSMHVFLLNIPRLEFAALIPKGEYVTLCLLGHDIDKELVQSFISSPEVKGCLPPDYQPPADFCHCSPKISVNGAVRPYADRMVFVGDCGMTRLYKDGIGAAYRTAKAAAKTVVFQGIGAADLERHYWPVCAAIQSDNRLGKVVFAVTSQIQKHRFARRAVWKMVSKEQQNRSGKMRMSTVLWDTFTGSAPYRDVFLRTLHPSFWSRLAWETVNAVRVSNGNIRKRG